MERQDAIRFQIFFFVEQLVRGSHRLTLHFLVLKEFQEFSAIV